MNYYINHEFITLNEYIAKERSNRFAAAKIKKDETLISYYYFTDKESINAFPIKINFTWFVKDKRKDLDNIAFAKKFILDGMVKAGIIQSDNLNRIIGFKDEIKINKENVGVEIEIVKSSI